MDTPDATEWTPLEARWAPVPRTSGEMDRTPTLMARRCASRSVSRWPRRVADCDPGRAGALVVSTATVAPLSSRPRAPEQLADGHP